MSSPWVPIDQSNQPPVSAFAFWGSICLLDLSPGRESQRKLLKQGVTRNYPLIRAASLILSFDEAYTDKFDCPKTRNGEQALRMMLT